MGGGADVFTETAPKGQSEAKNNFTTKKEKPGGTKNDGGEEGRGVAEWND